MHDLTHHFKPARFTAWSMSLLYGFAAIGSLSGCGKSEKIPTTADRLAAVLQKQETQPDFYVPRKTVDYMADLKSLKDAPARIEPAPVSSRPVPANAADPKPAARENAAAAPEAAPQQPAPQPVPTNTQTLVPTPSPTPAPPATASASAPPSNVVASSAPTARPAPKQDTVPVVSVISREQPEFPRDAMRAGIESGSVRARMTISAAGDVTDVAILQAQPERVFDRSVRSALGRWKFNAGADGRTFDTEVGFKAAN